MTMSELKVDLKNQYGLNRIFPDCSMADQLCRFSGRKTFSKCDIVLLRDMGFTFVARWNTSTWTRAEVERMGIKIEGK